MSTIKSEVTLYNVLERILHKARDTQTPVTSVECFDDNEVRKLAPDTNKVSDVLGHLWRSGYIERFPAPKRPNSQAKFAYAWKPEKVSKAKVRMAAAQARLDGVAEGSAEPVQPTSTPAERVDFSGAVETSSRVLLDRPRIVITNDGNTVTITLPSLIVEIRGR